MQSQEANKQLQKAKRDGEREMGRGGEEGGSPEDVESRGSKPGTTSVDFQVASSPGRGELEEQPRDEVHNDPCDHKHDPHRGGLRRLVAPWAIGRSQQGVSEALHATPHAARSPAVRCAPHLTPTRDRSLSHTMRIRRPPQSRAWEQSQSHSVDHVCCGRCCHR